MLYCWHYMSNSLLLARKLGLDYQWRPWKISLIFLDLLFLLLVWSGMFPFLNASFVVKWQRSSKNFFLFLYYEIVSKDFNAAYFSMKLNSLEMWSFEMMVLLSGLLPNPKLETSVLSIRSVLNPQGFLWSIFLEIFLISIEFCWFYIYNPKI